MHQTPHEAAGIADGRGRRRTLAEGHRLRSEAIGDAAHGGNRLGERRIPGNLLPARIGMALWLPAAQRSRQAILAVDKVGGGAAFGTQGCPGGMARIGIELREAPSLDGGNRAAARDAEAAKSGNLLRTLDVGGHASSPLARSEMTRRSCMV